MADESRGADLERIERLIESGVPCIAIATLEESFARDLVTTAALQSSAPFFVWTSTFGLRDGRFLDESRPIPETEDPVRAMHHVGWRVTEPTTLLMIDAAPHLGEPRAVRMLRELIERLEARFGTVVLLDHEASLPRVIEAVATRVDLTLPDEEELESIVRRTVREAHRDDPVRVDLGRRTLATIVRNLRGLTRGQAVRVIRACIDDDRRFDRDDVDRVVEEKRRVVSASFGGGVLEFVRSPESIDSIGGLDRLKAWLDTRRKAFHDGAAKFGLQPPRGMLLLGVQGAGKSLAAKAVSAAWGMPLLRLDPGALYDRYVGESERRLRDALHQAERMSPIVLWIDEIEKGFASAAAQSNDGGLSKRMFGTLLTWMQDHAHPVFLVATANDIEALPPELLRKGRFDEIFFVDLPRTDARREIARIHLDRRGRAAGDFDLDAIADASDGFSGAEIEEAIVSALHEAWDDGGGPITTAAIVAALRATHPISVTLGERIEALREWARGRCVPAD